MTQCAQTTGSDLPPIDAWRAQGMLLVLLKIRSRNHEVGEVLSRRI